MQPRSPVLRDRALIVALALTVGWFLFVVWQTFDTLTLGLADQGTFDHWEIKLTNAMIEWAEPAIAMTLIVWLVDQVLVRRSAGPPDFRAGDGNSGMSPRT